MLRTCKKTTNILCILQIVALEDEDFNEINIDVDEVCAADCGVVMAVMVPRQTKGITINSQVPVSKLLDLAMPHTISHTTTISVVQVSTRTKNCFWAVAH